MVSQNGTKPKNNLDPGAPFSQEAEEATLGSVIIAPEMFYAIEWLQPEDFYLLRHRHIWEAMKRIMARGVPIDPIILAEELEAQRQLQNIGGRAYLIHLAANVGTSMHAEVYAQIVQRTSLRRQLMAAADDIKKLAQDEAIDTDEVLSKADGRLQDVNDRRKNDDFVASWDIMADYYDEMEKLVQFKKRPGLPSGFTDLDALLTGFHKGEMLILAGRPGTGKSAFALTTAIQVARAGGKVAIFSLEMGKDVLAHRMMAIQTGINAQKLRMGILTPQELARFTNGVGQLGNLNIFVDDSASLSPTQMRSKLRRLKQRHGLDLVIIDYLQWMAADGYENNRVQEVSYISREIKEIARQLNVPVLALAQLNRAVENRKDKRPILSDLKESGSLEQDADVVLFLYREDMYNDATEFPNQADVIVAKHRNGPTGTISLYYEKSMTCFMNASVHRVDLNEL